MRKQIEKILSKNDVGETEANMAGILIPKKGDFLDFFPRLDPLEKNPRCPVDVIDDSGKEWNFNFIYYNSRFFGGTRNEYRLTGMTGFMREFSLKSGDTLIFRRIGRYISVSFKRTSNPAGTGTLRIGTKGWRMLDLSDSD